MRTRIVAAIVAALLWGQIAQASGTPGVAILGAPSKVMADSLLGDAAPCVAFDVLIRKTHGPIILTTAGLADMRIYRGGTCAEPGGVTLRLPPAVAADELWSVSLRPDFRVLTTAADNKLAGRILALDDSGPDTAENLVVQRIDPWWVSVPVSGGKAFGQALLVVFGALVPAAIAYWYARRNAAADRAQKQDDDFRAFIGARQADIEQMLRDSVRVSLYSEQVQNAVRAAEIWRSLADAGMVASMPDPERLRVRAAFRANNAEEMRLALRDALADFPALLAYTADPARGAQ